MTVPLVAGRTIDVGRVEVWREGGCLYVRYATSWSLAETHLHVAIKPAEFPQTKTGNPKPGQFDYAMSHAPGTTSHTECVPLGGLGEAQVLYFAAHAEVERWIDGACVQAESAWAAGVDFPGANWATYFAGALAGPALDLTGYWDMYITMDGMPEMGPSLFYIHQEGSVLDFPMGLSGTIEGSFITLSAWFGEEPEDHMYGEGTASEEEINMTFEGGPFGGPFGSGAIRMVPTTLTFGHLDIQEGSTCLGIDVEFHTDHAYAETWPESDECGDRRMFQVNYLDHRLQIILWFGFEGVELPIAPPTLTWDANLCFRWLAEDENDNNDVGDLPADSASVTLAACDENGMTGSFWANFSGEIVTGSFEVPFVYGYGLEPPEDPEDEGDEEEEQP